MKNTLLLPFLLLSVFTFSQMSDLVNNQWFLAKVEIGEDDFYPPIGELTGMTTFTENSSNSQFCNNIYLEYSDLNDEQFLLNTVSITMIECPDEPELEELEGRFGSIFWFLENQIFQYTIETDSQWGHIQTLVITNQAGNKAHFMNDALSTNDISKNNIQLSPNPVKEKLNIQNPDAKNFNIQISDATGKVILSQKLNSANSEINFSKYPKGIYFVTFESDGKIIKTEKIIKK